MKMLNIIGVIFALVLCWNLFLVSANLNNDIQLNSLPASKGFKIFGAEFEDASGYSVSNAGDVNGDGIDDVLVGAYSANPPALAVNSAAGIVYVVFGRYTATSTFPNITLSSITTGSFDGFRILGAVASDFLGWSVSTAGDINGDGVDDIIVGARYGDSPYLSAYSDSGTVYVIFGRTVFTAYDSFGDIDLGIMVTGRYTGFRISGAAAGDGFGHSVRNAGDVNGDGIDDVIIGALLANPTAAEDAGVAYVVFGRNVTTLANNVFGDFDINAASVGSPHGFRIIGAYQNDQLGWAVSGAGDINNDGVDDVVVGAWLGDGPFSDGGVVTVIFGRRVTVALNNAFSDVSLLSMSTGQFTGFHISGAAADDRLGSSVSPAGDINGDGVDDIIIGARYASPTAEAISAGICYVIFGRTVISAETAFANILLNTMITGPTTGFRILGAAAGDFTGVSVGKIGDMNGDSIDDVIIGAFQADPTPTRSNAGISYIVYGRSTNDFEDVDLSTFSTDSTFGYRLLGGKASDTSGYSVSGAGDINGDGLGDVIIGAHNAETSAGMSTQGISYVVFGVAPGPPSSQPTSQPSLQPSSQPSKQPTRQPSCHPSAQPSGQPSSQPSLQPSLQPTRQPSGKPTSQPSSQPVVYPTSRPSIQPTSRPSSQPSSQPTTQPTNQPIMQPSAQPTNQPSSQTSIQPSRQPSDQPSAQPSTRPSGQPSAQPSQQPLGQPTRQPTQSPSSQPSLRPTSQPSCLPSTQPTQQPSMRPSEQPSRQPTQQPSSQPTQTPSVQPSSQPSAQPISLPSAAPSMEPSGQPSTQPTRQPTAQPTLQPSQRPTVQPSSQPTHRPSAQPSLAPTVQPSAHPTGQPSLQPSTNPSAQPSTRPSVLPSSQPSEQPFAHPSAQPSSLPSSQPSTQPSSFPTQQPTAKPTQVPVSRPSSFPSAQPSVQPSARPSAIPSSMPSQEPSSQPSGAPSSQPSEQPSSQPSAQPSEQPFAVPTGQPSSVPTAVPTVDPFPNTWVTNVDNFVYIRRVASINNNVWVCGSTHASAACTVFNSRKGSIISEYHFDWNAIAGIIQADDPSRVILSGLHILQQGATTSDFATCAIKSTELTCTAKSFYDTHATAVTYVSFLKKNLLLGGQNVFASISSIDDATGAVKSYLYSSKSTKTIKFSHALSPPNYVGAFVAGTAVSTAGINCILSGTVRSDTGSMAAVYLTPVSGSILNSAELVNAMALEYEYPDSFIAGGLQLNDGAGMHAYLMRVNALIGVLKYTMRYRVVGTRRALSDLQSSQSVTRGMVRVDSVLFMIVDLIDKDNRNDSSLSVLEVNAETGLVLQQVQLFSPNASLSCTDITASPDGSLLYLVCQVKRSGNLIENAAVSASSDLSFAKLPQGFNRNTDVIFAAENIPFRKNVLPVSVQATQSLIVDSEFSVGHNVPTFRPSVAPTLLPSVQPSSAPSDQPSSSPTAAPSVSRQPTSHPSSSGPTNTYKPTVKTTQRPSRVPSRAPTLEPTVTPSNSPSARPTAAPSIRPSTSPRTAPSLSPSCAPSLRTSIRPSALIAIPSLSPSLAPSMTATERRRKDSDMALVIGGSLVGGLLGLWLLYWCVGWSVQFLEWREKKKAFRVMMMSSRMALDPHQQRIVSETVRQRVGGAVAAPATRIPAANNASRRAPVVRDPLDDPRYSEIDIECPRLGAYITGIHRTMEPSQPIERPHQSPLPQGGALGGAFALGSALKPSASSGSSPLLGSCEPSLVSSSSHSTEHSYNSMPDRVALHGTAGHKIDRLNSFNEESASSDDVYSLPSSISTGED